MVEGEQAARREQLLVGDEFGEDLLGDGLEGHEHRLRHEDALAPRAHLFFASMWTLSVPPALDASWCVERRYTMRTTDIEFTAEKSSRPSK